MHDKVGLVAEVTEGFCQKAEVAVPEKLVRADGEVGVEEDFQNISCAKNDGSGRGPNRKRLERGDLLKRVCF